MFKWRNRTNLFLEHSLKGAVGFFKEAIFSEDIARSRGFFQSVDPRVKLVFLAAILLATCFAKNIYWMAALYLVSLILALLSGVNLLFFIKRVWVFIPLFTLFIAIPAIFMQGLYSTAVFVLRVATCVSFVVLVTITTRHVEILRSMRSFGVPSLFVEVLGMSYRYIFFFVNVFEAAHIGLKSRLIGKLEPGQARYWIASRISYLFKRSIKMSEEVYLAMLARGYTRDIKRYGR